MESVMGVSPLTWQDRGLTPARADAGRSLDHESVCCLLPEEGRNGIYLFELEAQPGGPEGRSHTTAGSQPIGLVERPRSVPALRSCLLMVVVGSLTRVLSGGTSSQTRYLHSPHHRVLCRRAEVLS